MKEQKQMSWREYRRRQAWVLYEEGWTQTAIAKAVGVTRAAVSQWLKAIREKGVEEGLKAHPAPGVPSRLNDDDLEKLPELLKAGAVHYGLLGERWTGRRVAWLIEQEFGVSYSARQAQRILHKVGYSRQKPQQVAQQRNEKAVEQFQTEVIPEVKKK